MAILKLTKTVVETAVAAAKDYELRDTLVPGFVCKVTTKGKRIFALQYRTNAGERRKPTIGRFGELTVDQAREIARDWLADIRKGHDPSAEKAAARRALTVKELCKKFIEEYSIPRNKPSTVETYQEHINRYIIPTLGRIKVPDLTRADVNEMMRAYSHIPSTINRAFACLRKMLNMAEVWGYRPDGSNPCRHVPMYPEKGKTRFITDEELVRIYKYLDRADEEGLEHPLLILGIRLQFSFAARMSEIRMLEWAWVDLENRRVEWPDSKTGKISKPVSEDAYQLLSTAPRIQGSPYVCPSVFRADKPMSEGTYKNGWTRILKRAEVPHVGTHGIRHRAATDIANSGVSVKIGMALTAHKTATMFMRYVHAEDSPVREAAERVASLRKDLVGGQKERADFQVALRPVENSWLRTSLGKYRPYRHRRGLDRAVRPGSNHADTSKVR